MIRISALLIATACAATLAAEPTIIGPLAMRAGEVVEIDVYNPSDSTTTGGVDLLDAATGRVLDRAAFSVAGRRGTTVGFSASRAFVGSPATTGSSEAPLVVGVMWNGHDGPPLTAGEPRRVGADQKTIIGGFKSMSGMDSATEVVEDRVESGPFQLAGRTTIRTAALAGAGTALVELVAIADGTVAASLVLQSGNAARQQLSDAAAGAYVVRVTALTGGVYSAVSVESVLGAGSFGCKTMSPGGVAIESLKLAHEGVELDKQAAHEVAHVIQGQGVGL